MTPDLDLESNESDHRRAEGQRRGQVGAEVEKRKSIRHAGGTDHTHHLTTHTNTQRIVST